MSHSTKRKQGGQKNSQEEVEKKVFDMVGKDFTILSEYKGNRADIKIGHDSPYGYHEIVTNINAFVTNGGKCYECSKEKRRIKNERKLLLYIKNNFDEEYTVLDKYILSTSKLKFMHNKCGNIFYATPGKFKQAKTPCSKCQENYTPTQKEFEDIIRELTNGEFEVLGEYTRALDKIEMLHHKCGKTWLITPNSFLRGKRCPHCYGNFKKSIESLNNEFKQLFGGEFKVVGEYVNADSRITVYHENCNREFSTFYGYFLKRASCYHCEPSFSVGETAIYDFLSSRDYNFRFQHTLKNAKSVNNWSLWVDFAVFDDHERILALIEYDGIQHFEPVEFFGGEAAFKTQKKNDELKNDYCNENNLLLIRIPYWEINNIEKILIDTLHEFNETEQTGLFYL